MSLYIVGIGASAGGLEALRTLVGTLEPTGCVAYIVAQHLSPKHTSKLSNILGEECALKVVELTNDTEIHPDVVYVAPPNRDIYLIAPTRLSV